MAKDFKLMGEAYTKIYEQIPTQPATSAVSTAPSPVTSVGVTGAISDTAATDQVKKTFDTATTAYLKALGVDDANIKKFIDLTHTQFSKVKTAASTPSTSNYLPQSNVQK